MRKAIHTSSNTDCVFSVPAEPVFVTIIVLFRSFFSTGFICEIIAGLKKSASIQYEKRKTLSEQDGTITTPAASVQKNIFALSTGFAAFTGTVCSGSLCTKSPVLSSLFVIFLCETLTLLK